MKKSSNKKRRLKLISLYPLKTEEALALFMRVDPVKVEVGMRRMHKKKDKMAALPTR